MALDDRAAARTWRWLDDVLLVVALIPLAPAIFAVWLATRKGGLRALREIINTLGPAIGAADERRTDWR